MTLDDISCPVIVLHYCLYVKLRPNRNNSFVATRRGAHSTPPDPAAGLDPTSKRRGGEGKRRGEKEGECLTSAGGDKRPCGQ